MRAGELAQQVCLPDFFDFVPVARLASGSAIRTTVKGFYSFQRIRETEKLRKSLEIALPGATLIHDNLKKNIVEKKSPENDNPKKSTTSEVIADTIWRHLHCVKFQL